MLNRNRSSDDRTSRVGYYTSIALKDSWRSRSTLLTNSIVFAGICLLILLLIGLKSGLVSQFREDILKSPTATEGKWFATSADQALDMQGEQRLLEKLPQGSIVIPEIAKIVSIRTATGEADNVTLHATVPRDPFLAFHNAGIETELSDQLIVSPAVAESLGIDREHDDLTPTKADLVIQRTEGDSRIEVSLQVTIDAVVGDDESQSQTGYLSRHLMDQLEDFSQGEPVIERGWPGKQMTGQLGKQGYLAFSRQIYGEDERQRLHLRGLKATEIGLDATEGMDSQWRELYGLLVPHRLHVYWITSNAQSDTTECLLDFEAFEIAEITTVDDVMLDWSRPRLLKINGQLHRMIGLSGSMRWLKKYLRDPEAKLPTGDMFRVMLPSAPEVQHAELELPSGQNVKVACVPVPDTLTGFGQPCLVKSIDQIANRLDPFVRVGNYWRTCNLRLLLADLEAVTSESNPPLAIVPTSLLTALHRNAAGAIVFDPVACQFNWTRKTNHYFSGRFYASVLEDVPVIDAQMQSMGYSTISSKTRVMEMQSYAGTLELLVNILQVVAIALGIVTVSVLFMDITRRRQTSIGVMRILGMEPQGVFLFVFVRAVLIATLGWLIATIVSMVFSFLLPILTHAECRLVTFDFIQVLGGAIICSMIGVAFHAWNAATRLDPVTAISGGKVQ